MIKVDTWPDNSRITIDKDGVITFTDKQWAFLLKMTGSKAKTIEGQRKVIKALVVKALKAGIKEAKKEKK